MRVVDEGKSKCSFSANEMRLVFEAIPCETTSFEIDELSSDGFEFRCVSVSDVETAVRSVKSNTIGIDNMSLKFVKLIILIHI